MAHPRWQEARTVLLYHSLPDEPDTHAFVRQWAREKRILLPVVVGDDLELRIYTDDGSLRTGAFHIAEPTGKAFTDYAAIDLAIVPGVAFDREGNLFGRNLLFILNACSVQIIPATTIALRAAAGGTSPADIFLPAVICTAVCTGTAVAAHFAANAACRSSSRRYS